MKDEFECVPNLRKADTCETCNFSDSTIYANVLKCNEYDIPVSRSSICDTWEKKKKISVL